MADIRIQYAAVRSGRIGRNNSWLRAEFLGGLLNRKSIDELERRNGMDIQVFNNEQFGALRTYEEDGQVLFCGKDVAKALGYKDTTNAMKRHCRGVAKRHPITDSLGRTQEAVFISEPDLYRLITHSKLPTAEKFERWVFEEVLPAIRRTGGYMVAKQDETPEQIMARAVLVAQDTIERQKRQIDELKPKALFADAVAASDGTCLVGELAKMLKQNGVNIGQNRLFALDA